MIEGLLYRSGFKFKSILLSALAHAKLKPSLSSELSDQI